MEHYFNTLNMCNCLRLVLKTVFNIISTHLCLDNLYSSSHHCIFHCVNLCVCVFVFCVCVYVCVCVNNDKLPYTVYTLIKLVAP